MTHVAMSHVVAAWPQSTPPSDCCLTASQASKSDCPPARAGFATPGDGGIRGRVAGRPGPKLAVAVKCLLAIPPALLAHSPTARAIDDAAGGEAPNLLLQLAHAAGRGRSSTPLHKRLVLQEVKVLEAAHLLCPRFVWAVEVMQSEAGLTQRERKGLAAQKDQEDVNKEPLVRVAADDIPRIPVDHAAVPDAPGVARCYVLVEEADWQDVERAARYVEAVRVVEPQCPEYTKPKLVDAI